MRGMATKRLICSRMDWGNIAPSGVPNADSVSAQRGKLDFGVDWNTKKYAYVEHRARRVVSMEKK